MTHLTDTLGWLALMLAAGLLATALIVLAPQHAGALTPPEIPAGGMYMGARGR